MKTPYNGLLVLDKPPGMTSRAAVDRAQGWFPRRTHIGHTGTLDPLATGVLVLCLGSATRLVEYIQDMDKTYRARIRLGVRSDTDDADGTLTPVPDVQAPARETLANALSTLVGDIEQVPPAFSAAKVTGQRAYDLARRGKDVVLQSRRVHVYAIDLLAYDFPVLDVEVRCGKGTYIRSLARDLGERLGCGALIEELRRIRVGPFHVADAVTLDANTETARTRLLPMAHAISELPRMTLGPAALTRLRQGQEVPLNEKLLPDAASPLAIFDQKENLAAIAIIDAARRTLRPLKVLPD